MLRTPFLDFVSTKTLQTGWNGPRISNTYQFEKINLFQAHHLENRWLSWKLSDNGPNRERQTQSQLDEQHHEMKNIKEASLLEAAKKRQQRLTNIHCGKHPSHSDDGDTTCHIYIALNITVFNFHNEPCKCVSDSLFTCSNILIEQFRTLANRKQIT